MRLERDDGLEHRQRRGIGGRLGLARLAKDALDLGNLLQHAILDLKNLRRLVDRHAGRRKSTKRTPD